MHHDKMVKLIDFLIEELFRFGKGVHDSGRVDSEAINKATENILNAAIQASEERE